MKTIEIRLGDIEVENRVRKNVGDLTELCNSIEAIGLLHPIVLTLRSWRDFHGFLGELLDQLEGE